MLRIRLTLMFMFSMLLATAHAQQPWREYPSLERDWNSHDELPADYQEPGEFVVGRLMFPQYDKGPFGSGRGDWRLGGTAWTVDYPQGDRTFARLLQRLTTLNVRSVEQAVNLDEGDEAYFPFLISGVVGSWNLTDSQAHKLREYLLKGGFLLCDSFYGEYEWEGFTKTLKRIFPDRAVVELPDDHPIFQTPFDLHDKRQVPTWQYLRQGGYREGGDTPHWRAILDDDGRVMVMITFNNDVADGWQRADDPGYPQFEANLAIRLGVNFAMYALTH